MSEFRIYHEAVCTNCGAVAGTHENSSFLDPFFLPEHCTNCGEYRCKFTSPHEVSGWEIVTVKLKRTKKPFSLLRPSTWFSSWEDVSRQSNHREGGVR